MQRDIIGCGTALVTPFFQDGSVDEKSLRRLVELQIEGGVDFLVPCGATGEESTLEREEYLRVIITVLDEVKGRVPVVAGLGENCTQRASELAREVQDLGVDGILSVSPYYNRPNQEGIYRHFRQLAEAVSVPVILYNVPGRTVSSIEPSTVARLAEIPNIVGLKDASGNIVQQLEILLAVPQEFKVFSGLDNCTLPIMCAGAVGAISVAANEIPGPMTKLIHLLLEGHYRDARQLNAQLWPLMQANFLETNPVPVKAALAMMGLIEESYRLPLVPMKRGNRSRLAHVLANLNLLPEATPACAD